MPVRLAILVVALLVGTSTLSAQALEYAAGITRYRVSTTTTGSRTTPMGINDFEIGLRQQITVKLARQAKDTLVATVTLDSIDLSGSPTGADVSSLIGAQVVSLVSPTGKLYSTTAPAGGNPLISQIAERFGRLLPAYHSDLTAGKTWSDTTTGKVNQQGLDVDRTIVSNFKVERDTTIGGVKAYKVGRITTVRAAGSGTPQGTPVSLESITTSNGAFFVSSKGVYLGGSSTDDMSVKLTILSQGAEIRMKQSARTKIEPIQ